MSFNAQIKIESDLFQSLAHLNHFLNRHGAHSGKVSMTLRFEHRADLERFKAGCKLDCSYQGSEYDKFIPPTICGIELTVDGWETPPNPFA